MKQLKFCAKCGFDASNHRDENPEYAASCPRCSDYRERIPLTIVNVVESPDKVPFALANIVLASVKGAFDSLWDAVGKTSQGVDDAHYQGGGETDAGGLVEGLILDVQKCLSAVVEKLDGWVWTIRRDFLGGG